jgi:DNA polymerase III epsilon subunit-like protein
VNPQVEIPTTVTEITKITQQMIESKPTFDFVGSDWVKHLVNVIKDYEKERNKDITSVIMVAHNGRRFDVPFLLHQMKLHKVLWPNQLKDILYLIDTWDLALYSIKKIN